MGPGTKKGIGIGLQQGLTSAGNSILNSVMRNQEMEMRQKQMDQNRELQAKEFDMRKAYYDKAASRQLYTSAKQFADDWIKQMQAAGGAPKSVVPAAQAAGGQDAAPQGALNLNLQQAGIPSQYDSSLQVDASMLGGGRPLAAPSAAANPMAAQMQPDPNAKAKSWEDITGS